MTIEAFVGSRPFLYHLTHQDNVASIVANRRIESASILAERVNHPNRDNFLQRRRAVNVTIQGNGNSYVIRDQAQVRETVLRRSLDENCSYAEFIELLNSKVFFWSTLKDITAHYGTYEAEGPRILRFRTEDVFALNAEPKFCRLNSGATRPHPTYRPNCAPRGLNTFVTAENFDYIPSKVREVTFSQFCAIPDTIWIAENPRGVFIQTNQ